MHSSLALVFAILGTALVPYHAVGQSWPSHLIPGTRVWVTIPGASQLNLKARSSNVVGILDHLTIDSLYLRTVDSLAPLVIPRRLVHGLAISHGFTSRGTSALRRGAIYGAIGIPYFALFNELYQDHRFSTKSAAIAGGVSGIVLGVVYGLLRPSERWERLTLEPVVSSADRSFGAMVVLRW